MKRFIYEAIFTPNIIGGYDVLFPELGLTTQGSNLEDASYMAQDILALHLSSKIKNGEEPNSIGQFGHACSQNDIRMGIATVVDPASVLDAYMTVQEAADILDVSCPRIHSLIKEKILRTEKIGNTRMVLACDVMDRFNNPKSAGRPKRNSESNTTSSYSLVN